MYENVEDTRLIEALIIKIFTIEFKDIKSVCLNLTSMSD